MFPDEGPGQFMVNWTFVYKNYVDLVGKPGGPADEAELEDLGFARYPQTVAGEESKPPIGGIDIGVGAFSENVDWAVISSPIQASLEQIRAFEKLYPMNARPLQALNRRFLLRNQ